MAVFFKEYDWGKDINFQNAYNFTTFKFDMGLVYVLKIDQIAARRSHKHKSKYFNVF